jgi:hypothetical protein
VLLLLSLFIPATSDSKTKPSKPTGPDRTATGGSPS